MEEAERANVESSNQANVRGENVIANSAVAGNAFEDGNVPQDQLENNDGSLSAS